MNFARTPRALLSLATLAALGLAAAPAARADTPFIITTLQPGDITLTATGPQGNQKTPVALTASDGSNTALLTGSETLAVSDGTGLGFSSPGTFGSTVVEYKTGASLATPGALTLTFTNPVTEFGFYLEDAAAITFAPPGTPATALGTFTFTITGSDGTVTPLTATFSNQNPFFFGAQRSLNEPSITIKSVAISENVPGTLGQQDFFLGPVKAPSSAPEPSQFAAFAVGLLGLGALAAKARRRQSA